MTINKDFIIVLAWPEGMCKTAGSWYDFVFGKKRAIRGGHAAIVIVNSITKDLYYMDNGRYQTPLGFARIRDKETDPDVKIHIQAEINNNKIINIEKILLEIFNKRATHGEGTLYASVLNNISFENSYSYAKRHQERGSIPYGPFIINGFNCSRFVASTIIHSLPSLITKMRLIFPYCIIPTPKRNISICNRNYYAVDTESCKRIKRNLINGYLKGIERK
jgi:hypothetical protein